MLGPTLGGALFELGGFPVPFWVCGGATLALALATCLLLDQGEEQEQQQGGGDVKWAEILRSPGKPFYMLPSFSNRLLFTVYTDSNFVSVDFTVLLYCYTQHKKLSSPVRISTIIKEIWCSTMNNVNQSIL